MDFTGRLYFDFVHRDVWRFLQVLLSAQREGARPGLEWKPFLAGGLPEGDLDGHGRLLAAAEIVRTDAVLSHGPFVSAVLTAIHSEGMTVEDRDVLALAARVAQLDDDFLAGDVIERRGRVLLDTAQEEANALGVDAVPSIYRHGPVVAVRMTAAVAMGSGSRRLELIDAMLDDDGLWELRKP
jgi:2-hydroxychromene-2-carboxylate isomerase